jgi:hypothetical protein
MACAEDFHVVNFFAHSSKRVDNSFAMLDQVKVGGTEEDFHGLILNLRVRQKLGDFCVI